MITEIIIFALLAGLNIAVILTYKHTDNVLEATSGKISNLEQDISELDYQVEDLKKKKPKEKFNVELVHYEGKEVVSDTLKDVIEIVDNGYFDEWSYQYYTGDKTRFISENGEFVVKSEDVISINKY